MKNFTFVLQGMLLVQTNWNLNVAVYGTFISLVFLNIFLEVCAYVRHALIRQNGHETGFMYQAFKFTHR